MSATCSEGQGCSAEGKALQGSAEGKAAKGAAPPVPKGEKAAPPVPYLGSFIKTDAPGRRYYVDPPKATGLGRKNFCWGHTNEKRATQWKAALAFIASHRK